MNHNKWTYQFPLALSQPFFIKPRFPSHGQTGVGGGAEEGEVAAALIEDLECVLELGICVIMVSLDHVVDFMKVFLELFNNLSQCITRVHSPPMVWRRISKAIHTLSSRHCTWLEGSDVETGLVVPDGKEVIESVMRQRLHGGGGAVPSRL